MREQSWACNDSMSFWQCLGGFCSFENSWIWSLSYTYIQGDGRSFLVHICVPIWGVCVWKSDDNLRCWFSPSTLFETGLLFWLKALKPATLAWKRAPVVPTSTSHLEAWVLRLWMYDTVSRLKWVLGTQTQVFRRAWWTNSSAPWGMISCRERKKAGMYWRRGIGHTRVSTKNDKGLNATIHLRWGG